MFSFLILLGTLNSFDSGVAAYHQGDFDRAAELFTEALATQDAPGTHYNTGNSLARSKRWTEALAYYRAAQVRAPRDRDLLHNIATTRAALNQAPPSSQWLPAWLLSTLRLITLREALVLMIAWSWGFFLVLAGWQLAPGGALFSLLRLWIALGAVLALTAVQRWDDHRSVQAVLTEDTFARSEPVDAAVPLFPIPVGAELRVLRSRPAWSEVKHGDQQVWIRTRQLIRVP
jgi:tetratricopeptide (TPR) repeat protein